MSHDEIIRLEESLKSVKCSIDNVGTNLLGVFSQIGKLEDRVRSLEIEITATKTNLCWVMALKKPFYIAGISSGATSISGIIYGIYWCYEHFHAVPH